MLSQWQLSRQQAASICHAASTQLLFRKSETTSFAFCHCLLLSWVDCSNTEALLLNVKEADLNQLKKNALNILGQKLES